MGCRGGYSQHRACKAHHNREGWGQQKGEEEDRTRIRRIFFLILVFSLSTTATVVRYTANEGPVRIQYKCLVHIYVLPEMKMRSLAALLFPKENYNVLSPNFHILVSVSDLYIPRIVLLVLPQLNRQIDPGNI
jgi:hypothetical protein